MLSCILNRYGKLDEADYAMSLNYVYSNDIFRQINVNQLTSTLYNAIDGRSA